MKEKTQPEISEPTGNRTIQDFRDEPLKGGPQVLEDLQYFRRVCDLHRLPSFSSPEKSDTLFIEQTQKIL